MDLIRSLSAYQWLMGINTLLLLLSIVFFYKRKHSLQRMMTMLVGNLFVLNTISSLCPGPPSEFILIPEIVLLTMATILCLGEKFSPRSIQWRRFD